MVKTAASHAVNIGSNPVRVTILFLVREKDIDKRLYEPYNLTVGVDCGEGPPVPIPNTAVKLTRAEDTCLVTDW